MIFTDLIFLFMFLPITLLLYHVAGKRFKEGLLLTISLLFYACGSAGYFGLLVVSLFMNVCMGSVLGRFRNKKPAAIVILVLGISFNVVLLGYYKYFDFAFIIANQVLDTGFAVRSLLLPMGLSFYTFKSISYLVDIYRSEIDEKYPITAALYLSFFGQIQSGPISRYKTFENTGRAGGRHIFKPEGVTKFLVGFSKKILLSNVLNNIVIEVFDHTSQLSTLLAWLGAICYSLQLYYDFSGYSDMAIGICAMFGYDCPENFDYPYTAESATKFWRKWHITLGNWFRDYIYIPLGGSRVGKIRLYLNLFLVWLLTGLWHGADWNFIAWGMGYFIMIAFEKTIGLPDRLENTFLKNGYRIIVLFFINFQWVMFRSAGFREGISFIRMMILPENNEIANARAAFLLGDYFVFIIAAVIFAMPVIPALKRLCGKKRETKIAFYFISGIGLIVLFIGALSFVVSGQNNPFLYADF